MELSVRAGLGDVDRTCPGCGQDDHKTYGAPQSEHRDPRHIALGVGMRNEPATLASGQQVNVQVPVDEAWHFDCHATVGCDHCKDMLDHHDGTVKGKVGQIEAPPHLVEVDPDHFEQGANGVLRRKG